MAIFASHLGAGQPQDVDGAESPPLRLYSKWRTLNQGHLYEDVVKQGSRCKDKEVTKGRSK